MPVTVISRPGLWIPRPRRVLPARQAWMSLVRSSGGALLRIGNLLSRNPNCCCGDEPGIPCPCCTGNAPLVYEATVSGATECATCIQGDSNDVKFEWLEDPNRTWTLNSFGECRWVSEELPDAVKRTTYSSSDGTCTGFVLGESVLGWTAIFDMGSFPSFFIGDDLGIASVFQGSDNCEPKRDCMNDPFVLNNNLNCGVEVSGTGGTVTLSPA